MTKCRQASPEISIAVLTLFEKYGGFATISKVVMTFYDKVLDSDTLADYFAEIEMNRLIDHQTKFISQILGGPAIYTNEMLHRVHASHNIDQESFDEITGLLRETLEEFNFQEQDINHILNEVMAKARFIVTKG